jgi:glycosyltransferase involved in cell wall biosynthesis
MHKKRVAIIGTNGIPARYGGFETLAENLVFYLNHKYKFTVYCSNIYKKHERKKEYFEAKLKYLPFKANGIQSLLYDLISFLDALFTSETILFLGPASSGIFTVINLFFRRKIIINHGGLNEWEREKYNVIEKKWAKLNYRIASKFANTNIADNSILQKNIKKTFDADSIVIRYGGTFLNNQFLEEYYDKYPFSKSKYYLCIARAQVDNNLHVLIEAFNEINTYPLVIISNWNVSKYGRELKSNNINNSNVILLDAIYDKNELNFIRKNCYLYIHSHSYCGTAPSLVEVMCLKVPIICFDVPTNRETTRNKTFYFYDKNTLIKCLNNLTSSSLNKIKNELYNIATAEYTWENISKEYDKIL